MLILSSLDRVTADALLLVYFRGLTQDEAACALGLPRGTVSRCVAQGMRELAGRLLTAAQ